LPQAIAVSASVAGVGWASAHRLESTPAMSPFGVDAADAWSCNGGLKPTLHSLGTVVSYGTPETLDFRIFRRPAIFAGRKSAAPCAVASRRTRMDRASAGAAGQDMARPPLPQPRHPGRAPSSDGARRRAFAPCGLLPRHETRATRYRPCGVTAGRASVRHGCVRKNPGADDGRGVPAVGFRR
jgi:hypothetical protein